MKLLRTLAIACLVVAVTSILPGCSGKKDAEKDGKAAQKDTKTAKTEPPAKKKSSPTVKAEPIAHDKFPRPEGVEIGATFADTKTLMMRGPKKLDECLKFYEAELAKLKWTKNDAESETVDGVGFLAYEKGGLKLGITFNPGRDGKSMTIMAQGTGVSVPPEKED